MKTRRDQLLRGFHRAGRFRAAILILTIVVVACGRVNEQEHGAAVGTTFPFNERIGWLHGSCLVISNADLAPGTTVALVITAEPQRLQQARVQQRTDSPTTCQPLIEGRAAVNAKPGMAFYALEAPGIGPTDMGFGIVAPPANPVVVDGLARVDLDRDGRDEVFSSCATAEGINFAVWTEKAYDGEPRWSAYYYLDYESTPNCP